MANIKEMLDETISRRTNVAPTNVERRLKVCRVIIFKITSFRAKRGKSGSREMQMRETIGGVEITGIYRQRGKLGVAYEIIMPSIGGNSGSTPRCLFHFTRLNRDAPFSRYFHDAYTPLPEAANRSTNSLCILLTRYFRSIFHFVLCLR